MCTQEHHQKKNIELYPEVSNKNIEVCLVAASGENYIDLYAVAWKKKKQMLISTLRS